MVYFGSAIEEISDQEQEILLDKLNLRNGYGKTPLEMACILGKDGILSELIKRGADVNLHTSNGLYHHEISDFHAFLMIFIRYGPWSRHV